MKHYCIRLIPRSCFPSNALTSVLHILSTVNKIHLLPILSLHTVEMASFEWKYIIKYMMYSICFYVLFYQRYLWQKRCFMVGSRAAVDFKTMADEDV